MIERMTLIADDGLVSINGQSFSGLDLATVPGNIHAVQWYGSRGQVEFRPDENGIKRHNADIDSLEMFADAIAAWEAARAESEAPPPPLTADEQADMFKSGVQGVLDSVARERGYDSAMAICSYGDTGDATFDAEAKAFKAWRNAVWRAAFGIEADIIAGKRSFEEDEEIAALLPVMNWPAA